MHNEAMRVTQQAMQIASAWLPCCFDGHRARAKRNALIWRFLPGTKLSGGRGDRPLSILIILTILAILRPGPLSNRTTFRQEKGALIRNSLYTRTRAVTGTLGLTWVEKWGVMPAAQKVTLDIGQFFGPPTAAPPQPS